ncbi:hypothetical protein ACO34A_01885 [Rhizobium sp. ACO-34A]|nr:hypothetical protein ACO34A_01885 [Rhizobium sp. ACO-34A]
MQRRDADVSLLENSKHTTYCPYKGEARYHSLPRLESSGRTACGPTKRPLTR